MKYLIGALVIGLLFAPAAVAAQDFQVLVNQNNPVSSISAEDLSRIFQKKMTRWGNGTSVVPVDMPDDSPVRAAFTQSVHDKTVAAVEAYWQRQIFSGRAVPPVEKATDAEVLAFVAATANAVGYVSASTPLNSNVKVLRVTM
jgi:ABC-type phosphate transport system substrate-binding protein